MSTRRSSQDKRCPTCRVHLIYCYCDKVGIYANKTKISVIMHKRERYLTSNTANLAQMSLKNFSLFTRGNQDSTLREHEVCDTDYSPLFLYPSEDSIELTPENFPPTKKYNLIVPDGTWRQAKKIYRREAIFKEVPQVKLTLKQKSNYQLRKQKYDYGLCTYEAIVYALKILEPEAPMELLLSNFQTMVQTHLFARKI